MKNVKNVIGEARLREADAVLSRYRAAKADLDRRILENEKWFRLRHWETMRASRDPNAPEPVSAWLLNSIANKHADAMDSFPQPVLLPREPGDEALAEELSGILPAVLEMNGFEQVYSDMQWKKLKCGTGVLGVFWDESRAGGAGDIAVRDLDVLRLYWEPGIRDIQDSRNLFYVEMADDEVLRETYGARVEHVLGRGGGQPGYGSPEEPGRTRVVDWYYKKNGRLHYVKYAGDAVLYSSEDDPALEGRGFYDHGQYPVVFDTQFCEEDSPAGFGYIDVCKSPQTEIDLLNRAIARRSLMTARPRFFVRGGSGVNEEEYADWSNDFVHVMGASEPAGAVSQIRVDPVDGSTLAVLQNKILELKETSGNRDFNQGGTVSGVTAASAIAALQEAGNKLSRDMIRGGYRAFSRVCALMIALIRQFYTAPRKFRILGADGAARFISFDGARLTGQDGCEPAFDLSIRAEKADSFTTLRQNELAKEFYTAGFFKPENAREALACMEMMQFEGRERVMARIAEEAARLPERSMEWKR